MILIATDIIGGPGKGLFQFLKFADHEAFDYLLCNYELQHVRPSHTDFLEKAKQEGVTVHRLFQRARFDPSLVLKARKIVDAHGLNLIQTHGYKSNILGFLLKLCCRIPWIAFAHGYTDENRKMAIYNRMDLFCYKFADLSVTVSDSLKEELLGHGVHPGRIIKIHNAVDVEELTPKKDPSSLRRSLGISDGAKVLGVVGRLSPEKGHIVFLKALRRITESLEGVHALIVGDGQEKSNLLKHCARNGLRTDVSFTGHVTNVGDYFGIMDLLVIPSYREGLPNVLIEAMALGIPVVATSVGGIVEVLNGTSSYTVPAGDDFALAEKIARFLRDPEQRHKAAKEGKEIIASRFSPVERARRIIELYYRTLSTKTLYAPNRRGL